jgi:hypothetical protein
MAAATYRIGPSDFFTPGDLEADADLVDQQATQLDGQIMARGNDQLTGAWEAWLSGWRSFYGSTFGGYLSSLFASFNDGNRDALISYENQLSSWQQQAAAQGVSVIGAQVQASTGSKDTLGAQLGVQGLPSAGALTILIIVAVIALFVFKEKA